MYKIIEEQLKLNLFNFEQREAKKLLDYWMSLFKKIGFSTKQDIFLPNNYYFTVERNGHYYRMAISPSRFSGIMLLCIDDGKPLCKKFRSEEALVNFILSN